VEGSGRCARTPVNARTTPAAVRGPMPTALAAAAAAAVPLIFCAHVVLFEASAPQIIAAAAAGDGYSARPCAHTTSAPVRVYVGGCFGVDLTESAPAAAASVAVPAMYNRDPAGWIGERPLLYGACSAEPCGYPACCSLGSAVLVLPNRGRGGARQPPACLVRSPALPHQHTERCSAETGHAFCGQRRPVTLQQHLAGRPRTDTRTCSVGWLPCLLGCVSGHWPGAAAGRRLVRC
jgi:hypothetical protein